jgi:carbon monoxide dehydrogenase subunit G
MKISSETVIVNKPMEVVFDFLMDFNNYEKLMPEQVIKWESNEKSGRFTIKDLTEIGMRIENSEPHNSVQLHSDGKVPFDFTLTFHLDDNAESDTLIHAEFVGQVGGMIAMMAKRPLTNLVNHMVEQIQHHHTS